MLLSDHPNYDKRHKLCPILNAFLEKVTSIAAEDSLLINNFVLQRLNLFFNSILLKDLTKWGYKIWVLGGSSGFAYNVETYAGLKDDSNSRILGNKGDLGASSKVLALYLTSVNKKYVFIISIVYFSITFNIFEEKWYL